MLPSLKIEIFVRVTKFLEGASIKDVRAKSGIFDPLPPLVRVCPFWPDPPLKGRPLG